MFLKKLSNFVIKYKYVIVAVFAVLLILSVIGTIFLVKDNKKINSDMMSYLTDDFDTTKGLTFLKENYGIKGDIMLVVSGSENDTDLEKSINKIKNEFEGVTQVVWAEDANTLIDMQQALQNTDFSELDFMDNPVIKQLSEDSDIKKLFPDMDNYAQLINIKDTKIDASGITGYLKRNVGNGIYDYVITMMLEYSPSTKEATDLLGKIKEEVTSSAFTVDGVSHERSLASSGMTQMSDSILNETLSELPNYLVYAVIAVIIVLLLMSKSLFEPFVLIVTLGVSIVISMGVNYLYPSISIISFATSSVLQLAITMDYAIFYMHSYRRNRIKLNPVEATRQAIPEVASSIIASGLTTIGSFVSLYFMRFSLGADLANVLIKGVMLSIISILLLQPILTLLSDKLIMATNHNFIDKFNNSVRKKRPSFKGINSEQIVKPIAKFSVWQRIVLIIIAIALLVPSFLGQRSLEYSYFQMYDYTPTTQEEITAEELGNQLILAVPLRTRNGKTHKDFIEEVKKAPNEKVSGVVSVFSSIEIDVDTMEALLNIITSEDSLTKMEELLQDLGDKDSAIYKLLKQYLANREEAIDLDDYDFSEFEDLDLSKIMEGFDTDMLDSYFAKVGETKDKEGKWYTLYTISITGSTEDDEAAECYEYFKSVCNDYFGYNNFYSIGMLTGSYDMRQSTPTDFLIVTLISVGIILIIISILLKNPLKGLFLVILIELGIWINLSLSYLLAEEMNFMVYIIISSVQLGCTVDYAILLANTFERNRTNYPDGKECAVKSATETLPTIFTSALIIITVCMAVYFASNNLIIKQLTGMLARGALISFILVALVQPALMSLFKAKKNINYSDKLKKLEDSQSKLK